MTNCPNCGAIITGPKCEYCGTIFARQNTKSTYTESVGCGKNKKLRDTLLAKRDKLERDLLILENTSLENQMRIEKLYRLIIEDMKKYGSKY